MRRRSSSVARAASQWDPCSPLPEAQPPPPAPSHMQDVGHPLLNFGFTPCGAIQAVSENIRSVRSMSPAACAVAQGVGMLWSRIPWTRRSGAPSPLPMCR